MSVEIPIQDGAIQATNNGPSVSQKLGFAAFSWFAVEGLKSTVSYLAPKAIPVVTEIAASAIATATDVAHSVFTTSVPFAYCAGAAGGAAAFAFATSPTARQTAASGVRLGVEGLNRTAKKFHSAVSGIGSGVAEGVNFVGKNCPSVLGIAAISLSAYLVFKTNNTYFACQANSCFS